MRPFIEELSAIADVYVSAYPNAGLPNVAIMPWIYAGKVAQKSRSSFRDILLPAIFTKEQFHGPLHWLIGMKTVLRGLGESQLSSPNSINLQ